MSSIIDYLKKKTGEIYYPITLAKAVLFDDGKTLLTKINEMTTTIGTMQYDLSAIPYQMELREIPVGNIILCPGEYENGGMNYGTWVSLGEVTIGDNIVYGFQRMD